LYEYRCIQGKLQITINLSCDQSEHLLRAIAAFFYYHRDKALLEPPDVYQDSERVLEQQVKLEFEKLKMFFKERRLYD
jgi:hypothetical protein